MEQKSAEVGELQRRLLGMETVMVLFWLQCPALGQEGTPPRLLSLPAAMHIPPDTFQRFRNGGRTPSLHLLPLQAELFPPQTCLYTAAPFGFGKTLLAASHLPG